jgi:ketopantoate reductase
MRARSVCRWGRRRRASGRGESVRRDNEDAPNGRSSMQKDVDHHNPPELDAIAGPILRGGQKHGINVPATKQLVTLVEQRVGFAKQLA